MRKSTVFSALFTAALVTVLSAVPAAAQGKAIVTQLEGKASLLHGTERLPLAVGMQVDKGDVVVTDAGAQVDLSLNDKVGVRVLASTELLVADTAEASMAVGVIKGNTILNVDKLPSTSTFRVESPTAVAAVRGTQFWGRVDGQASGPVTTFAVREGSVEIMAKLAGKKFLLEGGQALDIPSDGSVVPEVRSALAGEMQAMEQASAIRTAA